MLGFHRQCGAVEVNNIFQEGQLPGDKPGGIKFECSWEFGLNNVSVPDNDRVTGQLDSGHVAPGVCWRIQ